MEKEWTLLVMKFKKMKKIETFQQLIPGKLYKILHMNKFDSYLIYISKDNNAYAFLFYLEWEKNIRFTYYRDFISNNKEYECWELS